jgi:hypothetical protein
MIVIQWRHDQTYLFSLADNGDVAKWTSGKARAKCFQSELEARRWLAHRGVSVRVWSDRDIRFVSA